MTTTLHTICGPQGSGKTTKSKKLRKELEAAGKKVMTVELVEGEAIYPHITQAEQAGYTDLIVERLTGGK